MIWCKKAGTSNLANLVMFEILYWGRIVRQVLDQRTLLLDDSPLQALDEGYFFQEEVFMNLLNAWVF